MTARFKMFKKIECTPLGKLGDRQGGMKVSDYRRKAIRLTRKSTKTHQLSAEDTIISLWS